MQVARTITALRATVAEWKKHGQKIAVVPTMGALHEAHLTLARAATSHAERRIVTIFVNPTQFNDPADLANYPRRESDDAALIEREGVDLLFAPDPGEMYPDGYSTTIAVKRVSEGLCGAFRPGHFDGVATVVAKLFNQTQADVALFGEKDYQQLHVVRRMARDLDIPITIIGHPTVREKDGLAMSSRNARLTPAERATAPKLSQTLFLAASEIAQGRPVPEALLTARHALANSGFAPPEYLELRSEWDLSPLDAPSEPARLLAAVFLGKVRLIDNVRVP
ncbi:MAG: pantoate--beta-alanine ligase [Micropepsaceae bacterium]